MNVGCYDEAFKLITALVDQQEEGLDKLELQSLNNFSSLKKHQADTDSIFSLMKASKEWKVEEVYLYIKPASLSDDSTFWAALARNAGTGHIGTLIEYKENMQKARKEDVKAV